MSSMKLEQGVLDGVHKDEFADEIDGVDVAEALAPYDPQCLGLEQGHRAILTAPGTPRRQRLQ